MCSLSKSTLPVGIAFEQRMPSLAEMGSIFRYSAYSNTFLGSRAGPQ